MKFDWLIIEAGYSACVLVERLAASKADLVMWSDVLRQELNGTGIDVTTVCPKYVSGHTS